MRDRTVHGDQLRRIRLNRGLSVAALAKAAGVSPAFIKYVEAGKTQPSDPYVTVLAAALGCDITDFSSPKPVDGAA